MLRLDIRKLERLWSVIGTLKVLDPVGLDMHVQALKARCAACVPSAAVVVAEQYCAAMASLYRSDILSVSAIVLSAATDDTFLIARSLMIGCGVDVVESILSEPRNLDRFLCAWPEWPLRGELMKFGRNIDSVIWNMDFGDMLPSGGVQEIHDRMYAKYAEKSLVYSAREFGDLVKKYDEYTRQNSDLLRKVMERNGGSVLRRGSARRPGSPDGDSVL